LALESDFRNSSAAVAPATLDQVARRAGVSTATVSRVLNNSATVAEATRRKVERSIAALDYHPNLHARTLARGHSRTVGVIVSNIGNPFFADIFCSLEAAATERGYSVVLEQTGYRTSRLVESVRSMVGLRLVGLAAIVSEMEPGLVEEIAARGIRAVFFDVGHHASHISNIRVRYETGMQRTIEYLYSLGHRRMAFIGHHASLAPLEARRKTFITNMKRCASDGAYTTVESSDGPQGGRDAARRLLASGFQPTAILCANDYMAIGALKELQALGIAVPQEVSVTGFDNIQLAEYANPGLTTVNVPRARIGQLCFEALVRDPGRPEVDRSITIEPELVVRESTGVAAKLARRRGRGK
jgi:DNA-binding LacI/PurR family transcriptional regulator